jgi:ABC-2 type transport system ATP-binding protein
MLEARGLRKAYGNLVAVNDVSVSVAAGEIVGLLGPNGAGKSTTVAMLCGIATADAGEVTVGRVAVSAHAHAGKSLVGLVPQDLALIEELSALDNILFFGSLYAVSGDLLKSRATEALELVGLSDRARSRPSTYSGGMRRRLNIACALVHDPKVLILDEPTVGIDPQSRNHIFESLETLRTRGKALLYTTHYMEEVERLCTSVAIMDNGRIIANDDIHTLIHSLRCDCRVVIQTTEEIALDSLIEPNLDPKQTGRKISVKLSDIGSQLPPILEKIRSVARIEQVQTETPTLEEVFLHLTGRTLRD